jgi:hypothetical protein
LESGFQGVRTDPVYAVAYLKLGWTQELVIRLGDEQARDLEHFVTGADHDPISQTLGIGFLFGRKGNC